LYFLVWSLIESDRSRFSLPSCIRFEYLWCSTIRRFIESSSDFLDFLDSSIWSSRCRRLLHPVSPELAKDRLSAPPIRCRCSRQTPVLPWTESFHILRRQEAATFTT
jgi:hypothetical protein